MTSGKTIVEVQVRDKYGYEIGVLVPVELEYLIERENDYGSDADGRRGEARTELAILDVAIAPRHLLFLTSQQVEEILVEAKQAVERQVNQPMRRNVR